LKIDEGETRRNSKVLLNGELLAARLVLYL